jgi:PAS domain S-box-containing protein
LQTGTILQVDNLSAHFDQLPQGLWPEPPHTAFVLPIVSSGLDLIAGFFIVGVDARQLLDDAYRSFFDLVTAHIATTIANAQAYEAERKRAAALVELDRAKTMFFNNVSHEFRTPLTLMLSPLEELLANSISQLTAAQHETLQAIHRNGLRLLKLVNSLLDFARIEADRVEISYEPTNLAEYTTNLASMFRTTVEKAGLKLTIDCPPLPEPIYVDREMWEKVVLNLLSNAFKFTLEGEITVRLLDVGDHAELQVQDTGVGIAEHELPNVFHRFYRVRNTQARTYEGSGIGLALVENLVRLHGGTVRVTSTLGQGSMFSVSIPYGTKHLPPDRIDVERSLTSTALGARLYVEEARRWLPNTKREMDELPTPTLASVSDTGLTTPALIYSSSPDARIVVVDDNADMRDYLSELLGLHWQVETYADGQSALIGIRKQRPDLVLSDVMMPGLDGLELLRVLRAEPLTHDLPFILLSARAGEEATLEGLAARADDYLVKPFSARELLARINAQLEMSQLRRRILETEQAARATAEAERERVSSLLNTMSDAFVVLDRDYRFTYLNPHAQELYFRLTGQTQESFLGSVIWDKFPGAEDSEFGQAYRRAMRDHIPQTIEALFPPLNTWFEVRVYPVDEGLSVYFQDITQRKQAEKILQENAHDLKRSNEDLERFAYIASHDLQGPLRTVTSYLQLLQSRYQDVLDQDGRDFLDFALGGAASMRELITDLLVYARVKTDGRNFVAFSSEVALKTAIQNLQTEVTKSHARIKFDHLPTIIGNKNQFVQVFQNLLSNAIKFHGKDAPEIYVNACRRGDHWQFAVKDNGIGIEQEYFDRIFIMFQRLHMREQYPGTGMGLAICKKVVEYHRGHMWLESKFGEGTTFYFTVPANER